MKITDLDPAIVNLLREGTVIPAVPLALDENRQFDKKHQRALMRYYYHAGAGGVAVGVHSTQFEIRDPAINLYEPVLKECASAIAAEVEKTGRNFIKIAGLVGKTGQALREAEIAIKYGYHFGLLSLSSYKDATIDEMIAHVTAVAEVIPVIGFYLQPSVGGKILPYDFWRKFAGIKNVAAIKMAPFNRYQTIDVVRAVCAAGKENDIVLYTGNDDNIINDLLTTYVFRINGIEKRIRIKGGLLGHWCFWTRKAVKLLNEIKTLIDTSPDSIPALMLTQNIQTTDANGVVFDAANNFNGCIPGIHEILRRQGLLKGVWCLNPKETLSYGQSEEIDRIYREYPDLHDDDFVKENLSEWLHE